MTQTGNKFLYVKPRSHQQVQNKIAALYNALQFSTLNESMVISLFTSVFQRWHQDERN